MLMMMLMIVQLPRSFNISSSVSSPPRKDYMWAGTEGVAEEDDLSCVCMFLYSGDED